MDGLAAVVGSSNFNRRSLDHDEEVLLVALDTELVSELDEHFDDDLRRSEQIDLSRWRDRGVVQKAREVGDEAAAPLLLTPSRYPAPPARTAYRWPGVTSRQPSGWMVHTRRSTGPWTSPSAL